MSIESHIPFLPKSLEQRKALDKHKDKEVKHKTLEETAREEHLHSVVLSMDHRQDDREYVSREVSKDGILLQYLPEKLRADRSIVLAAVKSYPHALEFASKELLDDFEIVMAAVGQWGTLLQSASSRLQDDEDIVLAAVKSHPYALRDASARLQDNEDIVYEAAKKNKAVMEYASRRLRNDKDFLERMSHSREERDAKEIEDHRIQIQSKTGFKEAQEDHLLSEAGKKATE